MVNKIMTFDSLYKFFIEQNKSFNFSSKESGQPIVVTTSGHFAEEKNDSMPGMLKLKLKNCHIDTNRNGSHISKENMEKAMPTLKYRPILAYIHELPDGTKDFYAHNIQLEEDENGDTQIVYLEKQVGCFTVDDPWLEYDEKMDKTYVMAYAVIPEEYTETADIIRRKGGTKVSTELVINELSYNAKEKYLDLTDFYFGATTLLGCDEDGNEIGEGMLGSRADISDFCHKEPVFTYQEKMIEVLDKLNTTLSNFNKDTIQKGGNEMNKFEELLEKYGKTVEDIDFEYSEMTDEELEAKFAELFDGEGDAGEGTSDSDGGDTSDADGDDGIEPVADDVDPVVDPVVDTVVENDDATPGKKKIENSEIKFELSHDDIRHALYSLLNAMSEDGYCTAWIAEVYDDNFIYEDYMEGKCYRQRYSKDGDNVEFSGDPVEVFSEWLSKEEKDALDALKAEYAALKSFKEQYDAAEMKAAKDAVLSKKSYEKLSGVEAFEELKANAENLSVDEVVAQAKMIYADFMEQNEVPEAEANKATALQFNFNKKENKKSPYGNLFNKD